MTEEGSAPRREHPEPLPDPRAEYGGKKVFRRAEYQSGNFRGVSRLSPAYATVVDLTPVHSARILTDYIQGKEIL
jgi:hypothetical protein